MESNIRAQECTPGPNMAPSTVCAQQSTQQLPPAPCQHADARAGATAAEYNDKDSSLPTATPLDHAGNHDQQNVLDPHPHLPVDDNQGSADGFISFVTVKCFHYSHGAPLRTAQELAAQQIRRWSACAGGDHIERLSPNLKVHNPTKRHQLGMSTSLQVLPQN